MSETPDQTLNGVSETLLVTLYLRAMESQCPDALIKDKKAVALVKQISDDGLYDFSRIGLLQLTEANKLVIVLRNPKSIAIRGNSSAVTRRRLWFTLGAALIRASNGWTTAGWSGTTWICRTSLHCVGSSLR